MTGNGCTCEPHIVGDTGHDALCPRWDGRLTRGDFGFMVVCIMGLVIVVAMFAGCTVLRCDQGASCEGSTSIFSGPSSSPTPTPRPSPSASPSASPTPIDPCGPVISVRASGAQIVRIGEVVSFDVTPVSPAGPLEGPLDYCNASRFPSVETVTPNLRCVGACGGWKAQFIAVAVGPFSVQFRVEGSVSPVFQGTVTQ